MSYSNGEQSNYPTSFADSESHEQTEYLTSGSSTGPGNPNSPSSSQGYSVRYTPNGIEVSIGTEGGIHPAGYGEEDDHVQIRGQWS
ncbi:hypothetical protein I204_07401 [Kwoniella mangroviensis CBS 8886]|uniref:hypothetical protein n=1 Tax=Kwoniella mangroviensis CBS 8507 TaxID=1296122 RepID=UPI00080D11B9|nr:hypothetical protein I204_07401 [Kwoniella mangroviensis CBS 8886]